QQPVAGIRSQHSRESIEPCGTGPGLLQPVMGEVRAAPDIHGDRAVDEAGTTAGADVPLDHDQATAGIEADLHPRIGSACLGACDRDEEHLDSYRLAGRVLDVD